MHNWHGNLSPFGRWHTAGTSLAAQVAALFGPGVTGGWYDPSDLSTLFQDDAGTAPVTTDGQPVGRINDKSGNGYHLTQAVALSRPTYRSSGGLHWLDFDGGDFLAAPTVIEIGTTTSLYLAGSTAGGSPTGYAAARDTGQFVSWANITSKIQSTFWRTGPATITVNTGITPNSSPAVISTLQRPSSQSVRVNGDAAGSAESTALAHSDRFVIGAGILSLAGVSNYRLIGKIYGVIIIVGAEVDHNVPEKYLSTRSGATL